MNTKDLKQKILEAKKETGTIVLAHTYQDPDIIDVADVTGDSFFLSKKAAELKAKRVIMCGVRFMAESVKILSPETETILPVPSATCPMAEQIAPERVRKFKEENPDTEVVAYINNLDADYGAKIILYKTQYPSDDRYNKEIVEYLNERDDISYMQMVVILGELGMKVDANGKVTWN